MRMLRKSLLGVGLAAALISGDAHAIVITPSPSDTVILFEAEAGEIDNSFDFGADPAGERGWVIDGVTQADPGVPAGTSGGSYILANEDTGNDIAAPFNTVTYTIDFQQIGFYSIYIRAAWTSEDLDGNGADGRSQNDSLYWGPTGSPPDGVDISDNGWGRANNIGRGWVGNMGDPLLEDRDDLTETEWRWMHIFDPPESTGLSGISGHGGPLPVLSLGEFDFGLGTREDGLVIDRVALVYQTNTDTITDAYFDALPNTTLVPEPTAAGMMAAGAMLFWRRRGRRVSAT